MATFPRYSQTVTLYGGFKLSGFVKVAQKQVTESYQDTNREESTRELGLTWTASAVKDL